MGTRGLLGFIIKGMKKGSYNHWDSYPTALGLTIIKFIMSLSEDDIKKMTAQLERIEWFDTASTPSKQPQDRYSSAGFSQTHLGPHIRIGAGRIDDWHNLLYKSEGGKALPLILNGSLVHMPDNTDFQQNTLSCEWSYWLDFEARTIEIMDHSGTAGKVDFKDLSLEYVVRLQYPDMTDEQVKEELEQLR